MSEDLQDVQPEVAGEPVEEAVVPEAEVPAEEAPVEEVV